MYAPNVAKTSGLGCLAAILVLLLACSGRQADVAKDGGGTDAAADGGGGDLAAGDAPDDSGCGPNVDFMNAPNNCGACGIRCCIAACTQGVCFCDGAGLTCCATDQRGNDGCYIRNVPVDTVTDPCHCGGCGIACPAGTTCASSTCVATDGGAGCRQP